MEDNLKVPKTGFRNLRAGATIRVTDYTRRSLLRLGAPEKDMVKGSFFTAKVPKTNYDIELDKAHDTSIIIGDAEYGIEIKVININESKYLVEYQTKVTIKDATVSFDGHTAELSGTKILTTTQDKLKKGLCKQQILYAAIGILMRCVRIEGDPHPKARFYGPSKAKLDLNNIRTIAKKQKVSLREAEDIYAKSEKDSVGQQEKEVAAEENI
jgi:hypothetical protein